MLSKNYFQGRLVTELQLQSKQGKVKDFNAVCDRLEKKYTEYEKID